MSDKSRNGRQGTLSQAQKQQISKAARKAVKSSMGQKQSARLQNAGYNPGAVKARAKKIRQKRQDANVSSAASASGYRLQDWRQMVLNPEESRAVRTPSVSPFTGAALTFVRTFTTASKGVDSPFSMIMSANLRDNIWLPGNYDPVVNQLYKLDGEDYYGSPGQVGGVEQFSLGGHLGFIAADSKQYSLESQLDPAGVAIYEIVTSGPTYFDANVGAEVGVWFRDTNGVWVNLVPPTSSARTSVMFNTSALPGGIFTAVSITGDEAKLKADDATFSIKQTPTPAGGGADAALTMGNHFQLFTSQAETLSQVKSYRITAMSLMASYSGNMFNNGGVIACARTRAGYLYGNDPYQSLTELQDHAYKGPLKDGAYVWWLPYDLKELEFRKPGTTLNGTELRVAGKFGDASGNLQVTVAMTVEFYSPLQIFPHEAGPPRTDAFTHTFHEMDRLPAATCNPLHTLIGKGKEAVATAVKQSAQLAIQDPVGVARALGM